MKIFNLDTKIGLIVWSVVLGLVLGLLINNFLKINYYICQPIGSNNKFSELSACNVAHETYGWPFNYKVQYDKAEDFIAQTLMPVANYFFWTLISLIVLFSVRYFRKKAVSTSSTQS